MPLQILLHTRAEWAEPMLRAQGHTVTLHPQHLDTGASTVVDIMQAYQRPEPAMLAAYIRDHERVVLFNSETPLIIRELAEEFDHPKVVFVTTGRMNWQFQCARVVEFENFFSVMQRHYSHHWLLPELSALRPYHTKSRTFDALLGLTKPHRSYVYQQIQHNDPDAFVVTYNGNRYIRANSTFWIPPGVDIDGAVEFASNDIRYHGNSVRLSHVIPIDIYNATAYSIVTETYTSNDFSFFTEKTAKCLLARRLFVMFAGQHYLRNLRCLGFQTFGSVIDESYDLEPDAQRRWAQAWTQVQYLCGQDQQLIFSRVHDVLEHNYDLISNGSWHYDTRISQIFEPSPR